MAGVTTHGISRIPPYIGLAHSASYAYIYMALTFVKFALGVAVVL